MGTTRTFLIAFNNKLQFESSIYLIRIYSPQNYDLFKECILLTKEFVQINLPGPNGAYMRQ